MRNPRRTLSTLLGVVLGVGLFSSVLFFVDGSSSSMTQRAIAPLPIDMQRVLTTPLGDVLRLTETLDPAGPVGAGQQVTVRLDLVNQGTVPANEVVLRSQTAPGFSYEPGSATIDGRDIADVSGGSSFSQGAAGTGHNLGTIEPGTTLRASYRARADADFATIETSSFRSSFSSREIVIPVQANAQGLVGLNELAGRIGTVDGVTRADALSFVDLPAGSMTYRSRTAPGEVRIFGFAPGYEQHYRDIKVVAGSQTPGEALVSSEAARALSVSIGDTVDVALPGTPRTTPLRISGITDLSQAKALFYSRQGANLEDFVYVPNSLVVDPETFAREFLPAFQTATAMRGDAIKSVPILEVDIDVERTLLDADPGTALNQTRSIADRIKGVAGAQDYLIDNISNTLEVARDDTVVAKRLFVFLGLPGGMLAAALAAYAGAVLAGAQRRELATLRIRGANQGHLLKMLALRTTLLTMVGSLIGVGLGLLSATAVLGADALARASIPSLILSGAIGVTCGFIATGTALYLAGQRSIRYEINEDRAHLSSRPPMWRRFHLDFAAVAVVAVLTGLAIRSDAFTGVPGSVYEGRGVELRLGLLALPIGVWIAGVPLLTRFFTYASTRLPSSRLRPFTRLVWGLLSRTLARRSWATAQAMIIVALVVALGTTVAAFTASYDASKTSDARYTVGSDIRVTPSPANAQRPGTGFINDLLVDGVQEVTPVVFGHNNTTLRSDRTEDAANMAVVDPLAYLRVTGVDDSSFIEMTAGQALGTLAATPEGILLSSEMADFLNVEEGDTVAVLLDKGTSAQAVAPMRVIGTFERLPGFPEGAGAMINIGQESMPNPDFYLARTTDTSNARLTQVVAGLQAGPGSHEAIQIESRSTALDKDQSSLAALNIHGLLTLDSSYSLAMGVVAIAVFVFGLLLSRRREYVTLRAEGMHAREIRRLIVAEATVVAVGGCVIGATVGVTMSYFFVNVLRPLFILTPQLLIPATGVAMLTTLVVISALITSVAATSLVNRLRPDELLRDD